MQIPYHLGEPWVHQQLKNVFLGYVTPTCLLASVSRKRVPTSYRVREHLGAASQGQTHTHKVKQVMFMGNLGAQRRTAAVFCSWVLLQRFPG